MVDKTFFTLESAAHSARLTYKDDLIPVRPVLKTAYDLAAFCIAAAACRVLIKVSAR